MLPLVNFFSHRFLRHLIPWGICLILSVVYGYELLLRVMPSLMVQPLINTYHTNATMIGLMVVSYYYFYNPLQLPAGFMVDRINIRRLLLLSVGCCVAAVFLFSFSPNIRVAFVARMMMGLGSVFIFTAALKVASLCLPIKQLPLFSGIITSFGSVGAISADWLLPRMINHYGWRYACEIIAYFGVLLFVLIFLFIKSKHYSRVAYTAADKQLSSIATLLRVVKQYRFWINGIIAAILFFPINVFASMWGVSFLSDGRNFSATEAASAVSYVFIGIAISAPLSGFFVKLANGYRKPLWCCAIGNCVILLCLIYLPSASHGTITLLMFLLGVAVGPQVLVYSIAVQMSPSNAVGVAVATTNFCATTGCALLQPLIGVLLDHSLHASVSAGAAPLYRMVDYQHALLVLPCINILAFVLIFFIADYRRAYQAS